jgi:vacuolar-type H+-ATPase subunit E/Vma4
MSADPYTDETASTQRFTRSASASERLREANFPIVVRGYHRQTVDLFIAELLEIVEDLESHQTREGVVQKALGELGEETAGILQRAHETADDITARSRAQADARLQRAEREAEILRRDADQYAEQVITDTRALWEERQRLIEDIRQLADDVLGTADDAIERLKLPEALGAAEAAHGLEASGELEPAAEAEGLEPTEGLEPSDPVELPEADEPPPTQPLAAAPPEQPRLGVPEGPEDISVRGGFPDTEAREESGHTVELEALPGGAEDPADLDRE